MNEAFIVSGDRYATVATWGRVVQQALYGYKGGRKVICIHGDARGIDTIAKDWCEGHLVDTVPMPYIGAEGKLGGPMRNSAMVKVLLNLKLVGYTVSVHAFHDDLPGSNGTKNLTRLALDADLGVYLHTTTGPERKITMEDLAA